MLIRWAIKIDDFTRMLGFNKIHQPSTWIEMPAVHTTGIIEKREYHKVIGEDDGF